MEEITSLEITPDIEEEYRAAIDRYLQEMEHMKRDMTARQARIEKLQAETQAILSSLKVA
jgi:hypothetical protein